jgi:KTSC domain-containing protein
MKRMSGGSLRSAGYDAGARKMVVELASGTLEYHGISADLWRRFSSASSPWSFYRDNIEEEFTGKRIR